MEVSLGVMLKMQIDNRWCDGAGWLVLGSMPAVGLRAPRKAVQSGGTVGDMPRSQGLPTPSIPDSVGPKGAQREFIH